MKEVYLEETSGMEQQTKGWMTTKLGNVLTLQRGFDLPSSERHSGTVPVVSSSGITGNHNVARVRAPGVITGRYGTLGEVFLLLEDFWPLNTTLYVKDFKGNDPRFVYYLLESLDFRPFSDKSSVPGLNRNHLHELSVAIPSALPEQRAIAHILGTLDDKIELNRQMNQTLDEIARTLFRSWFVDFDPVRAKAEGRQPEGMNAETAALFPDRFVDSELGPIPEGWEILSLGQIYELGIGGVWGKDEATESESQPVDVLRGVDLAQLAKRDDPEFATRYLKSSHAAKRRLVGGEILIEGSGSFCGRSLHYQEAMQTLTTHPVLYSNFCKRLDPLRSPVLGSVAWFALKDAYDNGRLEAFRTGSAFPNFDVKGLLASFNFVVPPVTVAEEFDNLCQATLGLEYIHESRTLAALRDTLLPELLSGRLVTPRE